MVKLIGRRKRAVGIAGSRLFECDTFTRFSRNADVLNRFRKLKSVLKIVHFGAFFGDRSQQAITRERIVDRVREFGGEIDVAVFDISGNDPLERLGMSVAAFDRFGEPGSERKQVVLRSFERNKI